MEKNKFYNFKAKSSGKLFDIRGISQDNCAELIQYHSNDQDNQKFCCFELDDGSSVIACKHSGKVLDVKRNSKKDCANIIQYQYHGGENQRFTFDGNTIKCVGSAKVLDVNHGSSDDKAEIIQYKYHGGDNQQFIPNECGNMNTPANEEIVELPDIPRMTSFEETLPDETAKVVTAEVFLPYFVVDDSIDNAERMSQTPYYKLVKKQGWRKLYQEEFSGRTEEERTEEYYAGITETDQQQMEHSIGMTLGVDFGFAFEGFSVGIKSQIEESLKVTETHTTEKASYHKYTETVKYGKGAQFAIAKWIRVDEYHLYRADGTQIANWSMDIETDARQDGYPELNARNLTITRHQAEMV